MKTCQTQPQFVWVHFSQQGDDVLFLGLEPAVGRAVQQLQQSACQHKLHPVHGNPFKYTSAERTDWIDRVPQSIAVDCVIARCNHVPN